MGLEYVAVNFFDRATTWWRTHPRLGDGLMILPILGIMLFLSGGTSDLLLFPAYLMHWPGWALKTVVALITGLHMLPWIIRRTNPVPSAAIVVAGSLLHLFLGPDLLPSMIMVVLTVQNLAHLAPAWASISGFVTALIGAGLLALKSTTMANFWGPPAPTSEQVFEPSGIEYALPIAIPVAALVVLFWAIGNVQRTRRVRMETLQNRAEQLAIEARQERELAAADERSRIARELHDIVAHSLQVIISQADGARYAAKTDPDVAPRTLNTIADTGRDALGQMRRLLGVLRTPEEAEITPQPGLAQLDDLMSTVRLSGLAVELHQTGKPPRQLAEGAELVLYRVVQEALTNVARHAGIHASATVTLAWHPTGVGLTIEDDGAGATAQPAPEPGGQGLTGMRERVALYDGTLTAGPKAGGGFRVHAHLPYSAL